MRGRVPALLFIAVCAIAFPVRAGVAISFPLEGRYRAGRYMPVRIVGTGEIGAIRIVARGAVTTELNASGDVDLTVPWLVVSDSPGEPNWTSGSGEHAIAVSFKPLTEDEALVAVAGVEPGGARELFGDKRVLPVTLDLSRPLLEPVSAWESLDAVVLSAAAAARVDDAHRAALLAAGTTLAVQSSDRPDARWPWQQSGSYWLLRQDIAGPVSAIEPDAYAPTYGWERGWPASFRQAVVFAAVLFSILGTGLLLWRSRWTVFAFAGLAALSVAAFGAWYARQSPVLELSAGVVLHDGKTAQYDVWTWQSPVRSADASFPFLALTRPVFGTLRQIQGENMRLLCTSDGRPDRFAFRLDPGQSQAMLTRLVRTSPPAAASERPNPSLLHFADTLYLRPGDSVIGQFSLPGAPQSQPTPVLLIRR